MKSDGIATVTVSSVDYFYPGQVIEVETSFEHYTAVVREILDQNTLTLGPMTGWLWLRVQWLTEWWAIKRSAKAAWRELKEAFYV